MANVYQKFSSIEEAVKVLGKEVALATLNHGHRDREYRKERQAKLTERNKKLVELEKKWMAGEIVESSKRKVG